MANVLVEEQCLQDIADAIRTKRGNIDTYTPALMALAINDIGSLRVIEDKRVTYGILDTKYISDFIESGGVRFREGGWRSIGVTQPDLTQLSSPCYLFEADLNYTFTDNSWSGLFSMGGHSSSGGVIFINSNEFIYYRNGSRSWSVSFTNLMGDFNISLACWSDKQMLFLNKNLIATLDSGLIYTAFSGITSAVIGSNESNTGERFKGILKKVSLKAIDLLSGTSPSLADFNL